MNKIPVGILGATGMVGQRFVTLLENHPWFEVVALAASPRSVGKTYEDAVIGRWKLESAVPEYVKNMKLYGVEGDAAKIAGEVALVFSALDMGKEEIQQIEALYARSGVAVVSNNSAHRMAEDIPMIMPEVNPHHLTIIPLQKKNRGWDKGFIVVKPNCSLQSYVPVIAALSEFNPIEIEVTTLQAISGAGQTFSTWPEMIGNCVPFIEGEEEKTATEPLKILGEISDGKILSTNTIRISATCIRVPVLDGHMASVAVKFKSKPSRDQIMEGIENYKNPIRQFNLPSAPKPFIHMSKDNDRPQTLKDRDLGNGMAISCGRFREDPLCDWKFISLSHNTIRGAAGGAILTAELLNAQGYIRE